MRYIFDQLRRNPDYSLGESVTRSNLVSFLIRSFAVSYGYPSAQLAFMEWAGAQGNFNWQSTIDKFVRSGGWDTLSPTEQEKFRAELNAVKKHHLTTATNPRSPIEGFESNPREVLERQLKALNAEDVRIRLKGYEDIIGKPASKMSYDEVVGVARFFTRVSGSNRSGQ